MSFFNVQNLTTELKEVKTMRKNSHIFVFANVGRIVLGDMGYCDEIE